MWKCEQWRRRKVACIPIDIDWKWKEKVFLGNWNLRGVVIYVNRAYNPEKVQLTGNNEERKFEANETNWVWWKDFFTFENSEIFLLKGFNFWNIKSSLLLFWSVEKKTLKIQIWMTVKSENSFREICVNLLFIYILKLI